MDALTISELTVLLRGLEENLLDPEVRKDTAAVAQLLAPGFREFGASGRVWSKADILSESASEEPAERQATDFKLVELSPDNFLLTYQSIRSQPGRPTRRTLRSSIWQREGESWRMIFHQGTVVPHERA